MQVTTIVASASTIVCNNGSTTFRDVTPSTGSPLKRCVDLVSVLAFRICILLSERARASLGRLLT